VTLGGATSSGSVILQVHGGNSSTPQITLGTAATQHWVFYTTIGAAGQQGSWRLYDAVRAADVITVSTAGALTIPGTLGVTNTITATKTATEDVGNQAGSFLSGTSGDGVIMFCSSGVGHGNASLGTIAVNKNTGTGRSINASGTINASGADYAEYEVKSDTCGLVAKGQIIGFDSDGKVTDKWANAFSFGVKSTSPSYVGGDGWGALEQIGERPEKPIQEEDDTEADYAVAVARYESDLAAFEVVLEAARKTVDRIAYSGKVPVNVFGASVGDYIQAQQDGDGIKGAPVATNGSRVVGRVRKILPDGRAEISVIVQ
jgi:hypothetical protein